MFLKPLKNYLLALALIYFPVTGAQIVLFKGETGHLPCILHPENSSKRSVEWIKSSTNSTTICKCQIDYVHKTSSGCCIPRFTLTKESLQLNIENVQPSDFGNYTCKWSRIIPPPTLDGIRNVMLRVEDLSLQRLNSRNDSCIHLLCTLEALNPEQVNFTWSTEGQRLPNMSSSSYTSSELYLCEPDWDNADTITCQASYFYNNTLYRRIEHFNLSTEHPLFSEDAVRENLQLLIIICSAAAAAGVIFSLIFTAVLCKCRRRRNANESIVFSNKVYENFSFAMTRQSTQRTQPTVKPQKEECIYEN
ncbi:uncharacterized protein LOC130546626 isoform X1 [Triplophysa rosa]|uniref:uncharacterized protein LOC130546626 isoform X1 n=1 Tax=Triplophysa rosa TaxID=992332 RepID=UPI002545D983|nr:uncharacterized protein LOC130546626 isoform X1 [Triplophysa rosa]XP_057177983.1 uncharacterized protein LOC130546626 isoform X1 [Triplophysa rosa]